MVTTEFRLREVLDTLERIVSGELGLKLQLNEEPDRINAICAGINTLTKNLRNSHARLEKYQNIFNTDPEPILVMEADTKRIVDVNPAAERYYGYSHSEFLGLLGTDVSAEPGETSKDMNSVAHQEKTHVPLRYHKKKDGTVVTVRITGGTFSQDGKDFVFGMIHPQECIEESLKREKEHILETNHRLKNAMAVIHGLLTISRNNTSTVDEFSDDLSNRILSIARLNEKLANEGWWSLKVSSILNAVTSNDSRVIGKGPLVYIAGHQAVSLGQVLYELNANALKHGSLTNEAGRVIVTWDRTSDGQVSLNWVEKEGPSINNEPNAGTGMRILRGLVEYELGGELHLKYHHDGMNARIQF